MKAIKKSLDLKSLLNSDFAGYFFKTVLITWQMSLNIAKTVFSSLIRILFGLWTFIGIIYLGIILLSEAFKALNNNLK